MSANKYPYVGQVCWPRGKLIGNAELIAPEWIITAPHVIKPRLIDSKQITARFVDGNGNQISAEIKEPFMRYWESGQTWDEWKKKLSSALPCSYKGHADWSEIAIAKLHTPINGITPAFLAESQLPPGKSIPIKIVTKDPIERYCCCLAEHQMFLVRKKGGDTCSGSPWFIEQNRRDVIVGIMQCANGGTAAATQPVRCKGWIDHTLKKHDAKANWISVAFS